RPLRRQGNGRCQPGISGNGPFRREWLLGQRELVKNVAAVGGVHQQQADPLLLLVRQLIRPQAPEIPQCQIAHPGHGGVGTAVAAGPQEQRPAEGPAVFRAE
ncbi:DUF3784 domain-containing protein, partial [Dysosmobacter welbionis]